MVFSHSFRLWFSGTDVEKKIVFFPSLVLFRLERCLNVKVSDRYTGQSVSAAAVPASRGPLSNELPTSSPSPMGRRGPWTPSHLCQHAKENGTTACGTFAAPTQVSWTPMVTTPRVSERPMAGLMPESVKATDPPAGCRGVTATTGLRSACFCQPPACPTHR